MTTKQTSKKRPVGKARTKTSESEQKLSELMLYVAAQCEHDRHMGAVKMNKILFFSDFVSYMARGRPITGATYEKRPQGPVPREGMSAVKNLKKSLAAVEREDPLPDGLRQRQLLALRKAQIDDFFTAEDISIVDTVVTLLRDKTASDASRYSHLLTGWQLAQQGEEIPYFTAFLPEHPPQLTTGEWAWAQSVAQEVAAA